MRGLKNKLIIGLFSAIIICSLIGCGKEKAVEKDTYIFGTIIKLKYYGNNAKKAIDESLTRLENIENKMSLNIENSEICNINKNSGKDFIKVSNDTFYVIQEGVKYGKLSNGSFDVSTEPISDLWKIGTDKARIPKKEEIESKLKHVNYEDVKLKDKNQVLLKEKDMAIDLGGIAKGYAADELKKIIEKYKMKRAFINIGGNLYAYGKKENGDSWSIGIQDPLEKQGQYLGILNVKNKSIVTSGNYERYFTKDGKRYHHIFDPKTGYPAENGLISTTIISDKSIDGDALSTATYVLGLDKGIKLIDSLYGIEAIFVTADKKIYTTKGVKENFKVTNKEYIYEKR